MVPIITTGFIFSLDYAGLERWVTPRMIKILAAPSIILGILILTNDSHHLIWTRIVFDGMIDMDRGLINWWFIVYAYLLSLLQLMVLVRLFLNSPRHRWVAAGLLAAPFIIRGTYAFTLSGCSCATVIDPMTVAATVAVMPYAIAVFHYNMFYVVPIARDTVLETMPNGMMVLDVGNRVVDINAKAKGILGLMTSKISGNIFVDSLLDAYPELLRFLHQHRQAECELCIGTKSDTWYHVSQSPLVDRRGYLLGRLVWFQDVTEQKQARERFIDKQRALAMLNERELLARDLHDGIGQLMAAADLQIMSAKILVNREDSSGLEQCLQSLEQVTQETKEIIREYLVGVNIAETKYPASSDQGLVRAVKNYIHYFNRNYEIKINLVLPSALENIALNSAVNTQLLPIIQEALTNVRRHSRATSARIVFEEIGGGIRVSVEDHGQGFDSEASSVGEGFGLRSMRGRAEMIGARFNIISESGKGTRVIIEIPWQKEEK